MPKPWEKYQNSIPSSAPWLKYQSSSGSSTSPDTSEITQTNSLARGLAQGASLGYSDELAGGLYALKDKFQGSDESLGDLYRKERDDSRKNYSDAEKANPKTYLAGQVGGGLATSIIPATGGLKGAVALGAAAGLGGSNADLNEGELSQAAKDTVVGAGMGAAGFGAGKALGYAGGKVLNGVKALGKKALTVLGPSEEAISQRFAGGAGGIDNSNPSNYSDLASELADDVGGKLKSQVNQDSQLSKATLDSEKNIDPSELTDRIDDLLKAKKSQFMGANGKASKNALESWREDINGLAKENGGSLSEQDVKNVIQNIDQDINWQDNDARTKNGFLQSLRHDIDGYLKDRNPDYEQAMRPLAKDVALTGDLKKGFNLQDVPGQGPSATDTTATKLSTVNRQNKAVAQSKLDELSGLTGKNYTDLSNDYRLSQQFNSSHPNGSRRTVLGGAFGSLIGGAALPGIGHAGGAALGAGAGALADTYGAKIAGSLIDSLVKTGRTDLAQSAQKALSAAASKGPQALAVTASLLQNQYKQILDK